MENLKSIKCKDCKTRNCSVFADSNVKILKEIDEIKTSIFYKKGEKLFEEGKSPRGLFCVSKGKVKVYQQGAEGKEQIVHMIRDGNIMGHRALFGNDTYSCSAIALEDTEVCFLPKTEFYDLIRRDGDLTLRIAQLLADELKEAEESITYATQQPILVRLVKALLVLQAQFGFDKDEQTLNIEIKRDDLSDLVGTTRETATRCLYKLQEQNLILLEGRKIKIKELSKLRKLIE